MTNLFLLFIKAKMTGVYIHTVELCKTIEMQRKCIQQLFLIIMYNELKLKKTGIKSVLLSA
mgnify:CR=1 FL=1